MLSFVKRFWGDNSAAPFSAACYLSAIQILCCIALFPLGRTLIGLELKLSTPLTQLLFIFFLAGIALANILRYGSTEKLQRVFGTYPYSPPVSLRDSLIDVILVLVIIIALAIMIGAI
jgi:hypothetical protein